MGHAIYHLDTLGKFFLQCPLEVDVLNKGAYADFFIIKYLVAALLTYRKSLFCHIQTELIDLFGWNVDTCPAVSQFVRSTFFTDFFCNLRRFFRPQFLIQHSHIGHSGPSSKQRTGNNKCQNNRYQQSPLNQAYILPNHTYLLKKIHKPKPLWITIDYFSSNQ